MTVKSLFQRVRRDQRGSALIIAAFGMTAFLGFAAICVDISYLYQVRRALQGSADAAALAGATELTSGATQAVTAANTYSAGSGGDNTISNVSVTASPQTVSCTGSTGSTCTANTSSPNGLKVTQTATVQGFFSKALGLPSTTISTTSYALASGGAVAAEDIMIILDTTASMNDADSSCSGATRENCALAGLRTMLQGFTPPTQQVGLMVFPGLQNTTDAAEEYDCSSSTPGSSAIAAYNASSNPPTTTPPVYVIVGLSSDYKSGSSLNTSSNLVKAARGGASGCTAGLTVYGGVGTYYADAVTAAQNYLTTYGRAGSSKMIILLSDGDANASASNMPSSKKNNQCHEGITAAKAAQSAGMTVVTIGYGSPSSGCSTDSSPSIAPCQTLIDMASVGNGTSSAPEWSYFDTTSGCTGGHPATSLSGIFGELGTSVSAGGARLIPGS